MDTDKNSKNLVDDALAKIHEVGPVDAMKWLHDAMLEHAASYCQSKIDWSWYPEHFAEDFREMKIKK